eukprot:275412-Heterocapsa_arctica.AAC.1
MRRERVGADPRKRKQARHRPGQRWQTLPPKGHCDGRPQHQTRHRGCAAHLLQHHGRLAARQQ